MHRVEACFVSCILLLLLTQQAISPNTLDLRSAKPSIWRITWYDEFDGANGQVPDLSRWSFDTGGEWGQNELQYYTNRSINAHVENGLLLITAQREDFLGNEYTSARLTTQSIFEQKYGRFEARIKLPSGRGLWPAFWLLGNNIDQVHWPYCGEIDVMEYLGHEPSVVYGSVHSPNPFDIRVHTTSFSLYRGQSFSDDFHLFAVEWQPAEIRFFVDGAQYVSFTPQQLMPGETWVYDHPFFIILNMAVGGAWPGNPDPSTVFPQSMVVDYIRVYSNDNDIQR